MTDLLGDFSLGIPAHGRRHCDDSPPYTTKAPDLNSRESSADISDIFHND
ncbi:MAG: hypothetical protein R3C01_10660 [Planctomycetaceae bacterium]